MPNNKSICASADRIQLSRIRILHDYGFYGLLLMHLDYIFSKDCPNVATDGRNIIFNPDFLTSLTDEELDIVMMHELLHVVLRHVWQKKNSADKRFDIACDIVVNSNILRDRKPGSSLTLKNHGILLHKAPDGEEGFLHTTDEIYQMLPQRLKTNGRMIPAFSDDHSLWNIPAQEDLKFINEWENYIMCAAEAISAKIDHAKNKDCGSIPLLAQRCVSEIITSKFDWRTTLNDFIQEEVFDYSFVPPDKRFSDSVFFLPDYNDKQDIIKDILFMIDTSGSMSDDEVATAFSEIHGAISQFGGKLTGYLGFFDAIVAPPVPFENIAQLNEIMPQGKGGTDFGVIFEYVEKNMMNNPPVSIIILTDGYAPFPEMRRANGIPVLWLLNNDETTPPWGKVARM